jgi:hypothetical protein
LTATGLHIIAYLVHESGNLRLSSTRKGDDPQLRFDTAMTRAKEALARITANYAGLPLIVAPACGSSPVPAP